MKEIWRAVKNTKGAYSVSNLGRVRSNRRVIKKFSYPNNWFDYETEEKILHIYKDKKGYCFTNIQVNKKKILKSIHRLVGEAFCRKPKGCNTINHLDANPSNNNAQNLEWTTDKGNAQHAAKLGLYRRGSEVNSSVFNEHEVRKIRDLVENKGFSRRGLARKYGVAHSTIKRIVSRETWAWVD